MTRPVLTYFSSRGLAEGIRLILAAAGVAYEQRGFADHPDLFARLKADGVLPFGSVPLWEEPDGFRLVQSDAILRYLAHAHGLAGANAREAAQCDQIYEGCKDLRAQLRRVATAEEGQRSAVRAELVETVLPRWLGFFEGLLKGQEGKGAGYFVGGALSYADLAVWLMIEALRDNGLDAPLDGAPGLRAFAARIEALPAISAWISSPARYPPQLLPT